MRRLPIETIQELREVGALRAFVPHAYGGDERAISEVLGAMTELSTGCASTAWVATLAAIHNFAAGWLPKYGQEEVFGDGADIIIASSVAPTGTLTRTTGGFRISGRWGFSSGIDHASWIMLGSMVRSDENSPMLEYRLSFLRASDVTIVDDWHSLGLRGTGSKSLLVNDVFVPSHRVLLLRTGHPVAEAGAGLPATPIHRLPWEAVFVLAFPPAALGTAMAMLDGFREYTTTRISRFSGRGFKTNTGAAVRMSKAAAQIDAARLMFTRDTVTLDRLASGDGPPSGLWERIAYDAPYVLDQCSRAVLRLYRGSGGRCAYQSNSMQRHFRDIHTMILHAAMDMDGAGEKYGRTLFECPALRTGVQDAT